MPDRQPHHPVDPLFVERWSPRAFDSSEMAQADMLTIFEAGRWAPSAYNIQPWRFLYARRGDANWDRFLALLVPANQAWARLASVLLFVLSDTMQEGKSGPKPSHTHSFDAGSAWMSMALQATRLGYHAHGMSGVDFDGVREALGVPERFRVEAAIAIGRQTGPEVLPEEMREKETKSDRRPIGESFFAGDFPKD